MTTRSVIIASAGSGKTFTLANRLIGWMVHRHRTEGEPGCDRLLASTFTRKAAGEILERVLQHLAQGVLDDEARVRYAESFGLAECPTRDELRTVLIAFIRLLHRVQINTLDGIFHRICQCFASEIGLPANWSIGEDSSMERLRAECVNEVLDTVDADSMALLIKLMQRGQRKRSVHAFMTRKIWGGGYGMELLQLIRATSMAPDPVAPWQWLAPDADGAVIDGGRPLDAAALTRAIDVLEEAPVAPKKDGTPNKTWTDALTSMVLDLREERWEAFLERRLTAICSVCRGEPFSSNLPHDDLIQAVEPLVLHAKAGCIRARHEELTATRSILSAIESVYRRRQYRAGLYTFGDVEQMLAECGVVRRESLGMLWFRLDGMIRDLAFDEFQDTSTRQYKVLEPLIEEVLSGEGGDVDRGFLVLADPKQSIYGWRGGTPGLIEDLEGTFAGRLDEESPLVRSWRSSSVVLEAVDLVFGSLETNRALLEIDHATEGAHAWIQHYRPHEAARELPGCAQVLVPNAGDDKPSLDHAIDLAVSLIAERHAIDPTRTIGVLVSRNKTVTRLVAALREAGVDASEEGSSLLVDSPAVLALLSLFHLADHPGDIRSLFHVSTTPLASVLGIGSLDELSGDERSRLAREISLRVRRDLLESGYGSYVQHLVADIESSCTERDARRLRQLVELAEAWESRATLQPGDFIRYVEGAPRSTAAAASVQVMTVHKSKGLEFDEVVLPELTREFTRSNDSLYLHRDRPTGPPTRVVPRMNQELALHFPTISVECKSVRTREAVQDALSVLYVAMTRARHALHMILLPLAETKNKDKKQAGLPKSATGLLRAALPGLNEKLTAHAERNETVLWRIGDPVWPASAASSAPGTGVQLREPKLAASKRPRRSWVSPSSRADRSTADILGSGRFAPLHAADRGTLIHELFRHVGWIEDGTPDAAAIQAALAATARATGKPVDPERREETISAFQRALEYDAVRHRLSRAAYADREHDELVLWRERPIQVVVGEEVVVGRFDRVVIGCQHGKPAWADIVDYKSDRVGDDGGVSLVERYASQLQTYVDAVVHGQGLESEQVTARLLCIGPGIDIALPSK